MPQPHVVSLLSYPLGRGVQAFSTERTGGFSKGDFASFNANAYCGDCAEDVASNRLLLAEQLGIEVSQLVIPHQVHGVTVRQIDDTFRTLPAARRQELLEGVDATMTRATDFCLCVSTADCIPIVVFDLAHQAIACIHAGWRGTLRRIVTHTLQAMNAAYGTRGADCMAAIGPGISKESFEVGDEVHEAFLQEGFPLDRLAARWPAREGHPAKWHIDLPLANRLQLEEAGLRDAHIHDAAICTYLHSDRFFSARRLGIHSGRILTAIRLIPSQSLPKHGGLPA